MVDRRGQLVEEPGEPVEVGGIEGRDARPELETDALRTIRIARREDHAGTLGAGAPMTGRTRGSAARVSGAIAVLAAGTIAL